MLKNLAAVSTLVIPFLFFPTQAQAITINLATGLDASNTLITTGAQSDAHWTVDNPQGSSTTTPAQTVYPGNPNWFGGWLANGPNSTWIARDANTPANGLGTYTRAFDLTGGDLSTVSITGSWAVDDTGILALNGQQIASLSAGAWGSLTPFSLAAGSSTAALLNQGQNQLTIRIIDPTDNFLEGVRLQGTLTGSNAPTSVPEPTSTLSLLALGTLGAASTLKRKLKSSQSTEKETTEIG